MKDRLITIETANLAIEKGCNLDLLSDYWVYKDENGDEIITSYDKGFSGKEETYKETIATQSLLQKWLREKKQISVSIETGWNAGAWIFEIYIWQEFKDIMIEECFLIYENALEFGLREALKLIK